MRKKLSATMSTPDLPTGFTECEYLESNEAQWIKTDYIFTNQDDVSCVAELIKAGFYWANLFGYYDEWNASLYFGWMQYGSNTMGTFGYGSVRTFQWPEEHILKKMNIQLTPAGNLYINNVLIANDNSNKNTFPTKYPASLFTANNKGNYPNFGLCSERIFSFDIKRAGTSVFTPIPVLDANNVPCMYDLVSRKTLYNAGKGTFGYKIKATREVVAPVKG